MRVLVTGHRGYIGSVVTTVLRHARFEVAGLDCDLYGGCDFGRSHRPASWLAKAPSFDMDLRDVEFTDLLPFDAVVHLAALPSDLEPGEPVCWSDSWSNPFLADEEATLRLADGCRKAGVSRLLYLSTCDVYGRAGAAPCNEQAEAMPISASAQSKLRCEAALTRLAPASRLAGAGFSVVVLRVGEVYGVSPRLRLDTPINEYTATALLSGRLSLSGDASAWRSPVHVEDVARACRVILARTPASRPAGPMASSSVLNLADDQASVRLVDVADKIIELIPGAVRTGLPHAHDEPSYRADGSKFTRLYPDFSFRWSLERGIGQLACAFGGAGLTPGEFRSDRYRRLLRFRSLGDADSRRTGKPGRTAGRGRNTYAA